MTFKTDNRSYFYAIGRRKNARATVKVYPEGTGTIMVNETPLKEWSDTNRIFQIAIEALELLDVKKDFDIAIRVSGGGKQAQSEAIRLGITRALIKHTAGHRTQLKQAGFLTRDPRVKERKKPGLKKARRAPQFSKR